MRRTHPKLHPRAVIIEDTGTQKADTEVVVVETDATHRDYDSRLAGLWQSAEQRFAERVPFPREHRIDAAVLGRDFDKVAIQPGDDSRWHFCVTVSDAAQVEPVVSSPDGAAQPPSTMSTIRLPQPDTSIDVIGMVLPDDVDVAGWLDEWLEQAGMVPHSSRPKRTARGVMGDVVATWRSEGGVLVVRYTTVRFAERTFLLVLRSPMATYRLVAREFMLAVATLRPLHV